MMNLALHSRFTDGKKKFRIISLEFFFDEKKTVTCEFLEEGVPQPIIRKRDHDYMNNLLNAGKLKPL